MQHNAHHYRARRRAVVSAVMVLAGIMGIALLTTACSSGSSTTTDAAGPGASPASSGASTPGSSSSSSQSSRYSQALAYSQCIRAHGVPDFPDPTNNNGNIGLNIGNLKESQSTLQAAMHACQSLSPVHPLTGSALAQNTAEGLKWAQCIRAHGVPNFPDPNSSGAFDLPSGLNPQSASLQAAMNACQAERPKQIQMGSGNPPGSSS
jgi:hypothetical protein